MKMKFREKYVFTSEDIFEDYELVGVNWSNECDDKGLYMGEVVSEDDEVYIEGYKYLEDDGIYIYVQLDDYENETKDAYKVVIFKKVENRAS